MKLHFFKKLMLQRKKLVYGEKTGMVIFFYSPGTNNSQGLITLIKDDFLKGTEVIFYKSERILGIKGLIEDEEFYFINIYGPNPKSEQFKFLNELYNVARKCESKNIIYGGDFNMVVDNNLDIIAGAEHDEEINRIFKNWIFTNNLIDCWRDLHAEEKDFTWHRSNPFCARRLDYIFISEELRQFLLNSNHSPVTGSDHKMVKSKITSDNLERGQGYWKFNNDLLHESSYLKFMNDKLDSFLDLKFDNPKERLEYLKIMVKAETIVYSKSKKTEDYIKQKHLEKEFKKFNDLIISDPLNKNYDLKLMGIKKELELFELNKARGARVRAKMKEVEAGEKNNKYFLAIEKHKGASNLINRLNVDDNEITDQTQILEELKSHFEKIGEKNLSTIANDPDCFDHFLEDIAANKISEFDKVNLDSPLTIEEVGKALFLLDNDSSPGLDGITANWFKVFYSKIKILLFECYCSAIDDGELATSQKLGVINLIHKGKDLRRDVVKNWRPITITNCDYKIFSKCIALRLQKVLDKIIDKNQTGFMKGRNITDHIRIIDDIINLADKFDLPGYIVSLDFAKAFDSINKDAILHALKYFNFGNYLINCVDTIMKNSESCVSNNGWLSSFFEVNKGVRQGCPISPLLFIIAVELLAIKIRSNKNIKGLTFKNNGIVTEPQKILQYCDDTTLLLNSTDELLEALKDIDEFRKISGLTLNIGKSIGFGIGASKDIRGNPGNIQWKNKKENTKILGIYFNSSKEASDIEENWIPKIEKIKELAIKLQRRKVTLWGKVLLCKTFLLSQVAYNIQALSMPAKFIVELESICFKFIWKKQNDKKRS